MQFDAATNGEHPLVSVIIAAYNAEETIERAITSVQRQSLKSVEIIVVDDASKDSTKTIVEKIRLSDSRVCLISLHENGGQSNARNLGIARAIGKWIAILDADDAFVEQRLYRLVNFADRHSLDMVADNQLWYDAEYGAVSRIARFTRALEAEEWTVDVHLREERVGRLPKWGLLKAIVRADRLQESQISYRPGFRMGEDSLFYMELLMCGMRAAVIAEPLYIYTTARGDLSRRSSRWSTSKYRLSDHLQTYSHFRDHYRNRLNGGQLLALSRCELSARQASAYIEAKGALANGRVLRFIWAVVRNPTLLAHAFRALQREIRAAVLRTLL